VETTSTAVRSTVRMDKWLWAARFFKTRALAAKASDIGRIHSNEIQAKPARDVRVGDVLKIKNEAAEFVVEVLALSEMRGPAAVAQTLYRETDASREPRLKLGFVGARSIGGSAVRWPVSYSTSPNVRHGSRW
jgi:ribosome-associated heat shock protein Hsp15